MLLFLNLNNINCKYNLMNAFASEEKLKTKTFVAPAALDKRRSVVKFVFH